MNEAALKISPELLRLIAEINEFKGSWRAVTTLAPERLAILKRVATIAEAIQRMVFSVH